MVKPHSGEADEQGIKDDVVADADASESDSFILKLDADGNFIWVKTVASELSNFAFALDVANDGTIRVGGVFQEVVDFDFGPEVFELTSEGSADVYMLKLTTDGDFVWAKAVGNELYDRCIDVAIDDDGNSYFVGVFEGEIDSELGDRYRFFCSQSQEL